VKTCRNCVLGKKLSREHCNPLDYPSHPNWRPRSWPVVLICAAIGLALTVAMCIVIAVLDQERINAIPRPEPMATSFVFVRPACAKIAVSAETWKVYESGTVYAETWTLWTGGYAISKGE
jgi:hypothetical protein